MKRRKEQEESKKKDSKLKNRTKEPESIYIDDPPTPKYSRGIWALTTSCMAICVFPIPGTPQNSVIFP